MATDGERRSCSLGDRVSRRDRRGGRFAGERIETDRRFHGDGGWLDGAREELEDGSYANALFKATHGMQFAGEDLG